ncbi:alpha-1,3/1,6-mannosyltransferase ALG2-like [Galendromus occidentalis]|uniref:Alpha-1,3/1,6-mannosyltransferase ALG2-like n=1 Tax=Galendromus occidentalis TaxID=34638 RepID=A0AAJ6QNZ7_9ACAR|nr:alpha-1,3/1,6-mannosyltransferase ALG2-like [Galendromus occidentalis]
MKTKHNRQALDRAQKTPATRIIRCYKTVSLEAALVMAKTIRGGRDLHLVVAGGFDSGNKENIEHNNELVGLATKLDIGNHVTFLKSPSDKKQQLLMHLCLAVVYTPENEHFGIVPIEAMYSMRPVIATNTGGPLETIEHNSTGFLCEPTGDAFGRAMLEIATSPRRTVKEMGSAGRKRVVTLFSFEAFQRGLCELLEKLVPERRGRERE